MVIVTIFTKTLTMNTNTQNTKTQKFQGLVLRKDTGTPVLEDYQKIHVSKLAKIITKWYGYQDHSTTGCGKTFTTMEIARRLKYKVLVISPSGELMNKWRDVAELFGVKVLDVISYSSLAGRKNCELSHDYLVREDEGKKVTFYPTDVFDEAIKDGLFVVFDESHRTKNKTSARSKACQALIKHVIQSNKAGESFSRMAVLSASPGNELDHIVPLLRLLGFITQNDIYKWNIGTRGLELPGYNQLVNNCRKYLCKTQEDKDALNEILDEAKTGKKKEVMETIGELYHCFIKYRVGNAMVRPKTEFFPDYHTCFYNLTLGEAGDLSAAITKLSQLVHKNGIVSGKMGEFQSTLVEIEKAKLPMVARQVKKELASDPNRKVLVYVNNLASIDYLMRELEEDEDMEGRVREMSGSVKKQTAETIKKFQENNDDVRVILCTIGTGSEGIDLDDKYGTHPRTMFLMPRYNFIAEYQSTGRIYRGKYTKSKAAVRFMYGNGDNAIENSILDSVIRKTKFSKYFLTAEGDRVPFPGDYDKYEENEEGELVMRANKEEDKEE